jgi:branched-subunit amino acid ABC-type transport system permease component
MTQLAKILVLLGVSLILAGGVVYLFSRMNININRLPGNFFYSGENFSIYIPCATSIILSIILTILLNVIFRMMNK